MIIRIAVFWAALGVAAMCASATVLAQDCSSTAAGPAIEVEYERDGAAVGIPSALRFKAAADGTLRAEDIATGSELWTFRAPEAEAAVTAGERMTGLAVLRFDSNGDGVIDPRDGDRVWLYFGFKRAGAFYYALDVTDRTPRLLWRADGSTMNGLGDAWSTPAIARIRVGGARQNGEQLVVLVGGGLETGNALFMLDAASGRVLWSAGISAPANFISARMTEGFASRLVAIDFDGDQFTDRLYAADVGGRVWRFDVWNGRTAAQLVTGGVFASLGAIEPLSPTAAPLVGADARRFFVAPDVAYIRPRGELPYYNVSLGSGDASSLGARGVQERFYALRDYAPFKRLTQAEYDASTPIFDDELPGPKGWKLDLAAGERVLADSITVNGATLFTTFRPTGDAEDLCGATGTNRVYAVKVESPQPALDLNDDGQITDADASLALDGSGAAEAPRIELVRPGASEGSPGDPTAPGTSPESHEGSATTRCLVGTQVLKQCIPLGTVVRTFWKRATIH